jgi:integrase
VKDKSIGFILQRPDSRFWWLSYPRYDVTKGRTIETRESSKIPHLLQPDGTPTPGVSPRKIRAAKAEALGKLAEAVGDVRNADAGLKPFTRTADLRKLRVDELFDDLEHDYKLAGKWSSETATTMRNAREGFGHYLAAELKKHHIDAYILEKQKIWKPASINRITKWLLQRAYKVGMQNEKVVTMPYITRLSEVGNTRKGFLEPWRFRIHNAALPEYLRPYALFGYSTGWRADECRKLTWPDVSDDGVRISNADTKTKDPRFAPMDAPGVLEAIEAARKLKVEGCDLIFHHEGQPISDPRWAWRTANRAAGWVGGFHDFRRSTGRNLTRAGWTRTAVKALMGHRTDSMFSRYQIHEAADFTPEMMLAAKKQLEASQPPAPVPPTPAVAAAAPGRVVNIASYTPPAKALTFSGVTTDVSAESPQLARASGAAPVRK